MKKYTTVLIFLAMLPCFIMAQAKKTQTKQAPPKQVCVFEKLFSVKPGMDMPAGVAALQQLSKITLLEQVSEKRKPYVNTGGDSILHQTLTYRIDSTVCLQGRDNKVKFDFADGLGGLEGLEHAEGGGEVGTEDAINGEGAVGVFVGREEVLGGFLAGVLRGAAVLAGGDQFDAVTAECAGEVDQPGFVRDRDEGAGDATELFSHADLAIGKAAGRTA